MNEKLRESAERILCAMLREQGGVSATDLPALAVQHARRLAELCQDKDQDKEPPRVKSKGVCPACSREGDLFYFPSQRDPLATKPFACLHCGWVDKEKQERWRDGDTGPLVPFRCPTCEGSDFLFSATLPPNWPENSEQLYCSCMRWPDSYWGAPG